MTDPARRDDDEVSLFAVATTLLRNWRLIGLGMFVGAVIAVAPKIATPAMYSASASFFPQGHDASRSGLASIAGQFGVAIPSASQSSSSEFYADLVESRVILRKIALDTFVVRERGGRRESFMSMFDITGGSALSREEDAVAVLRAITDVSIVEQTGVVKLSVATPWPSLSLSVVSALVERVNEFNQTASQNQAVAERRFIEGRLADATSELRNAEERLEHFLRTNRNLGGSPELMLQRERIQRDVALRQQVFTSLTQAYEEARVREVREMPAITVLETPSVSTRPEARGRLKTLVLGLLLGGLLMASLAIVFGAMAGIKATGSNEGREFVTAASEFRRDLVSPRKWFSPRTRG